MIWFIVIMLIYLGGWLWYTLRSARSLAADEELPWSYCHSRGGSNYESICRSYHGSECWRGDASSGDVTPALVRYAAIRALWWPCTFAFSPVYWLAARQPSAAALANRIDELERECDMN